MLLLKLISIRLFRAALTMFIVLIIAFVTLRLSGTPFDMMYPEGLTDEQLDALQAKHGSEKLKMSLENLVSRTFASDTKRFCFGSSFCSRLHLA